MTRRLASLKPDLRDRWTFDDDAAIAPEARIDQAPEAREEALTQPHAGLAPIQRDFLFLPSTVAAPTDASTVHHDEAIMSEADRISVAPPPPQSVPLATASSLPSPWTTIQVSDKARARAAAAGLHRYVEERSAKSRRLMWVSLSAIALLFVGAAIGLQQFAATPGAVATQSAETPFPDVSAERPSYIEVPPATPRAETLTGDAPLIEVAP